MLCPSLLCARAESVVPWRVFSGLSSVAHRIVAYDAAASRADTRGAGPAPSPGAFSQNLQTMRAWKILCSRVYRLLNRRVWLCAVPVAHGPALLYLPPPSSPRHMAVGCLCFLSNLLNCPHQMCLLRSLLRAWVTLTRSVWWWPI